MSDVLDSYPKRVFGEARPFRATSLTRPHAETWGTSTVTIFKGDAPIGAYERNYFNFNESTFEPFEQSGRWYALYAPDYTTTRLMSLPGCTDIGGEDPAPGGFCPVEFYVPRYREVTARSRSRGNVVTYSAFESAAEESSEDWEHTLGPWCCLDVAFVAGCIWGDDSSWKVQVIDLSRAAQGVIARTERFGFLQLAPGMSLVAAVRPHFDTREADRLAVTIIEQRDWDLKTGKFIHPYD